jgi:hypothetical protein
MFFGLRKLSFAEVDFGIRAYFLNSLKAWFQVLARMP